jgi:flagellar motility protein MotE (MotC chaperone)
MLRKIWDIFSMIAVVHLLAVLVLLAVLAVSGALGSERMQRVRDALAGRPPEVVTVTEPAKEPDLAALATSGQMIARQQAETQMTQLRIDQQMRELKAMQAQVDSARAALDGRMAEFDKARQQWQAQRKAESDLLAGEGFKKQIAFFESMEAEKARDLLMTADDAEAVRVLSAMEERKAGKVVKAFTTDAEKARLRKILDRLAKPLADLAQPPGKPNT